MMRANPAKHMVEKFPLMNSLAYHALGSSAESTGKESCAQEFIFYIKEMGPIIDKNISQAITKIIKEKIPQDKENEKYEKKMLQCVNLRLNPEEAGNLFPDLMSNLFEEQDEDDGDGRKISGKEIYEEVWKKLNE